MSANCQLVLFVENRYSDLDTHSHSWCLKIRAQLTDTFLLFSRVRRLNSQSQLSIIKSLGSHIYSIFLLHIKHINEGDITQNVL